eukprot:1832731-Prorocentrum_lima.AAC.1
MCIRDRLQAVAEARWPVCAACLALRKVACCVRLLGLMAWAWAAGFAWCSSGLGWICFVLLR